MVQENEEEQILWNNEGDKMKIRNDTLQRLLRVTQREQTIAGKSQKQVHSTMLRLHDDGWVVTTNLVRDGVSSLSLFSALSESSPEGTMDYPVPDIDLLLGVLKQHGEIVTLIHEDSKLRIRSGKKSTTIPASKQAKAHLNSTHTVEEWFQKSLARHGQIKDGGYYMNPPYDELRKPFCRLVANSNDLFEACRCDTINNQKLNRYLFTMNVESGLQITVGNELKGRTTTMIESPSITWFGAEGPKAENFDVTLEGGLENVFSHYPSSEVTLDFFDFRPEGQGIRILFAIAGDYVLQAGLLI